MELIQLTLLQIVVIATISYGLGSIPAGILVSRTMGLPDPRTIGSGNIGATNVLRTGSRSAAAITLLVDSGKGFAAVLAGFVLAGDGGAWLAGPIAFL